VITLAQAMLLASAAKVDDTRKVEGVRFERPLWTVAQCRLGQYEGQVSEFVEVGDFWTEAAAGAERERLASLNTDPDVVFDVIEGTARGIYPADESPPWDDDLKRLAKRGYDRLF
jgi:hypothetical protein